MDKTSAQNESKNPEKKIMYKFCYRGLIREYSKKELIEFSNEVNKFFRFTSFQIKTVTHAKLILIEAGAAFLKLKQETK